MLSYAGDGEKGGQIVRFESGHLDQSGVTENDVGRHPLFVRQLLAELTELLEQRLVVGAVADRRSAVS